jgi:DMSO/TMAO reductase YedYZ heme-binding membrane subunit
MWSVKADRTEPTLFGLIVVLLLATRLVPKRYKKKAVAKAPARQPEIAPAG